MMFCAGAYAVYKVPRLACEIAEEERQREQQWRRQLADERRFEEHSPERITRRRSFPLAKKGR